MRIPFILWSAVVAASVYGVFLALGVRDYGTFDPLWDRALLIGGIWLGLVVLEAILNALRKAFTSRPADIPSDVARELDSHPEH
jgi:type VI protein secretion system component VasK